VKIAFGSVSLVLLRKTFLWNNFMLALKKYNIGIYVHLGYLK
jgi:hypothetical protein